MCSTQCLKSTPNSLLCRNRKALGSCHLAIVLRWSIKAMCHVRTSCRYINIYRSVGYSEYGILHVCASIKDHLTTHLISLINWLMGGSTVIWCLFYKPDFTETEHGALLYDHATKPLFYSSKHARPLLQSVFANRAPSYRAGLMLVQYSMLARDCSPARSGGKSPKWLHTLVSTIN